MLDDSDDEEYDSELGSDDGLEWYDDEEDEYMENDGFSPNDENVADEDDEDEADGEDEEDDDDEEHDENENAANRGNDSDLKSNTSQVEGDKL